MDGVVKEVPVPKEEPPEEAGNWVLFHVDYAPYSVADLSPSLILR